MMRVLKKKRKKKKHSFFFSCMNCISFVTFCINQVYANPFLFLFLIYYGLLVIRRDYREN